MTTPSPLHVVQAQLDAFNAKNLDALLQTYAEDAEQFVLHGERLAQGREALRARYRERFAEPDLKATLLNRSVVGNVVTDLEIITRNFAEGVGTLTMLCIYEVTGGQIVKASFVSGEKRLLALA
jgi:putative hydrolase of HD superfamily